MRIAIVHQAVPPDAGPDDRDVLVQAAAVDEALARLGHERHRLQCSLDLETFRREIDALQPDVVFNLIESLAGHDALAHFAPLMLDMLSIPYTGSDARALTWTNDKLLAKTAMRNASLPTPDWQDPYWGGDFWPPYIVKAVRQHASLGIDDNSVVLTNSAHVAEMLRHRNNELGRECFIERYIEGREFNLSLLDGPECMTILPAAEIDFSAFPTDKPRIVGFDAKWQDDSFAYQNTPRRFRFAESDRSLLAELKKLAMECWKLFHLRGYARVDFRVDERGQPWILEVNTNPCLSPDAGFAAALVQAGITFDQAINRILATAATSPPPLFPPPGLNTPA